MFVLVVVVPLFTCVVVFALGCTGLASIGVGTGICCWISFILLSFSYSKGLSCWMANINKNVIKSSVLSDLCFENKINRCCLME